MDRFCSLFVIICLCVSTVAAQDDWEEFNVLYTKMDSVYTSKQQFAIDVSYQFFEDENPNPIDVLSGEVVKRGSDYFTKIGATDFVYINNVFLKINHTEKAMLYTTVEEKQSFIPIDLQNLKKQFSSVTITQSKDEILCELHFNPKIGASYSKMLLVIDRKNHTLKKQELFMPQGYQKFLVSQKSDTAKPGSISIAFSEKEMQPIAGLFTLSEYVIKGDKLKPSKKFNTYQFYNTTHKL